MSRIYTADQAVLVVVAGILLGGRLCATSQTDNQVPSIFEPHSTPAELIYHLSHFVLAITGLIFLVVCALLTFVVVKFRNRASDDKRDPAQVYGRTQIELAWTVIPILIGAIFLYYARNLLVASILDLPLLFALTMLNDK